jgi:hypothetical protein
MTKLIIVFCNSEKALNDGYCEKTNIFSDVKLMSPPPQNFVILLPIIGN